MRRRQRHGERGRCTNLEQPLSGSVYIHIYMYISVTRLSLTWSLCPWRVNYKVEPTIPSLAKRNRWIQLASRGETNPRLHPFNRSLGPGRCVFTDRGKKRSIRAARVIDLLSVATRRGHPLPCKKCTGSSFNYHPGIYLSNLLMERRSMERLESKSICAPFFVSNSVMGNL